MQDYKDPSDEKMSNGRSLADCMRPGPHGLRGIVVAKATPGGMPSNFNPHDFGNIQVNMVSPDGSKVQSLVLGNVSKQAAAQAIAAARSRVQGNDIESIRERAAVAFEELAKISSSVQRVPTKTAAQRLPVSNTTEEELIEELQQEALYPVVAAVPVEQVDRNYSPMAAFGLKKSGMKPAAVTVATSAGQKIGAPQQLVYFEKEGLGTVPAFYHEVIINVTREDVDIPEYSGFIVLIYDLRFDQNAARWFPPANDPYQRPWAVQIKNDQRLYLVYTTGFQYIYDNREHCVLRVERAMIAPTEEI